MKILRKTGDIFINLTGKVYGMNLWNLQGLLKRESGFRI